MAAQGYRIRRAVDPGQPFDPTARLVFEPERGSDALFDALSWAFPTIASHKARVGEAVRQFYLQEALHGHWGQEDRPPSGQPTTNNSPTLSEHNKGVSIPLQDHVAAPFTLNDSAESEAEIKSVLSSEFLLNTNNSPKPSAIDAQLLPDPDVNDWTKSLTDGSKRTLQSHSRPVATKPFCCRPCARSFTENRSLMRHRRSHACRTRSDAAKSSYVCVPCGRSFAREDIRRRHMREVHENKKRATPKKRLLTDASAQTTSALKEESFTCPDSASPTPTQALAQVSTVGLDQITPLAAQQGLVNNFGLDLVAEMEFFVQDVFESINTYDDFFGDFGKWSIEMAGFGEPLALTDHLTYPTPLLDLDPFTPYLPPAPEVPLTQVGGLSSGLSSSHGSAGSGGNPCGIRNCTFHRMGDPENHMRGHEPSVEGEHVWPSCPNICHHQRDLQRHTRLHVPISLACEVCGEDFLFKKDLERPRRAVHLLGRGSHTFQLPSSYPRDPPNFHLLDWRSPWQAPRDPGRPLSHDGNPRNVSTTHGMLGSSIVILMFALFSIVRAGRNRKDPWAFCVSG